MVNVSISTVFLDAHCRYVGPTDESGFNLINGRES